MSTPPIKRHPALQPLSREHMSGLVQARDLVAAAESSDGAFRTRVLTEFARAWNEELAPHFLDEERMLASLISEEDRRRLMSEHEAIRVLVPRLRHLDGPAVAESMAKLGALLHDHIRWEERHLFNVAERAASEQDLESMERRAAEIEAERPGSRARRRL